MSPATPVAGAALRAGAAFFGFGAAFFAAFGAAFFTAFFAAFFGAARAIISTSADAKHTAGWPTWTIGITGAEKPDESIDDSASMVIGE